MRMTFLRKALLKLGGVALLTSIVVSFSPYLSLELHRRSYWKGVEQIRGRLDENSFQSIRVWLGKSPKIPIEIYGSVETREQLNQVRGIIEPFKAQYDIDFRVEVQDGHQPDQTRVQVP